MPEHATDSRPGELPRGATGRSDPPRSAAEPPDLDVHAPRPADLERHPAQHLLTWALRRWGDGMALAMSFQVEGMVLLDMARRAAPNRTLRVFTIDTGRLPPETHNLMERVRSHYGVEVEVFVPDAERVERLVRAGGPNLFYRSLEDRLACCHARKVEPLGRALAGLDAWMTGLRRDQSPTRTGVRKVAPDPEHGGITKLAPLADWTADEVWSYIREHEVPYHPLYDRGYTSIGCAPCTRPTRPDEDPRAGRWWWERSRAKECGLHGIGSRPLRPLDSEAETGVDLGTEA